MLYYDACMNSSDLDIELLQNLEDAGQKIRSLMWEQAKKESINPTQMGILKFCKNYSEEKIRIQTLAKHFRMTEATLSDSVSCLVKKGFLIKERCTTDKRMFFLSITQKGKDVIKRASVWEKKIVESFKSIPKKEKQTLNNFLKTF